MTTPQEFKELCLTLLDRLGTSEKAVWTDHADRVLSYHRDDLVVLVEDERLIVQDCKTYITVWDDRLGGSVGVGLQTYYEQIHRWMVLEQLADA